MQPATSSCSARCFCQRLPQAPPHPLQSATHQRQLGARAMKILYHGAILMAHVLQPGPPPLPTFHPLGNWLSPSPVPVTSLLDGGPGLTTGGGGKFVDEAPLWADRGEDRLCLEPFCTWMFSYWAYITVKNNTRIGSESGSCFLAPHCH